MIHVSIRNYLYTTNLVLTYFLLLFLVKPLKTLLGPLSTFPNLNSSSRFPPLLLHLVSLPTAYLNYFAVLVNLHNSPFFTPFTLHRGIVTLLGLYFTGNPDGQIFKPRKVKDLFSYVSYKTTYSLS